jgi:ABC-type transport system involved in cytochrome bd biosynthesis fused ATPase/permease subunit
MEALSGKTVLLVTHQVDFLPAFDSVLVSLLLTLKMFFMQNEYSSNKLMNC